MDWQQDVEMFHIQAGLGIETRPTMPDAKSRKNRIERIKEECEELVVELETGASLANVAKEAFDLIYTTLGAVVDAGIDLGPIWKICQGSNMAKVIGQVKIKAGKVQKPEGWLPPDVQSEIERQQND